MSKDQQEEVIEEIAADLDGTVGQAPYPELISENYLLYAVSTLLGRALPYIDGLKPVQRRILHSMHQSGLYFDRGTVKSALIVGEVMGKFHPHGDSSIYEALVRMSQDFSMRVPLIDGQGNFGNIDGDAAAAMRYTEARLTKAAMEIIADSHPEILDKYMGRNYTEDLPEPGLLPTRFPNLLINGSTGIATGMTSVFLPHNPAEALDLCVWRLKNPEAKDQQIVARLSGPDFPTGAAVINDQGLQESYLTGKGRVIGVAKAHIEPIPGNREKVVITEIPWGVDKGKLLMDITRQYEKGNYPELSDLVDYSDKDIRIEAPLKRNVNAQAFLAKLLNNTALRKTYAVEMNVVIDGVPKTVNLRQLVDEFLTFRRLVVINRAKKRIGEIEARLYKLEAYLKVIDAVDAVVETIKKAKDRQAAKPPLKKLLKIDDQQAQWIVEMQLGSLTRLDSTKLKGEAKELNAELKELQKFIKTPELVTTAMIDEFKEIKADWGKQGLLERRTTVIDQQQAEQQAAVALTTSDSAAAEDCLLLISAAGQATCSTGSAKRGAALALSGDDHLAVFQSANTGQDWLIFSDQGLAYRLRLAELPIDSRKSKGVDLRELIGLGPEERVVSAIESSNSEPLLMFTAGGTVKRSAAEDFANVHSSGVVAAKVGEDRLIKVCPGGDHSQVIILASNGKALRFPADKVRVMGRNAGGVRGMKLGSDDRVIAAGTITDQQTLMISTDQGFAKQVEGGNIPSKGRDGQGVEVLKPSSKYGQPSAGVVLDPEQDVIVDPGQGKNSLVSNGDIAKVGRAIVAKRWSGPLARWLGPAPQEG
jgi:DNA gyrase subunit A